MGSLALARGRIIHRRRPFANISAIARECVPTNYRTAKMVEVELNWSMVERDLSLAGDDDVVFQKSPDELNSAQEMGEGKPAETNETISDLNHTHLHNLLFLYIADNRSQGINKSIKFVRAFLKLEDSWQSHELQSTIEEIGRLVEELRLALSVPYSEN